MVTRVRFCCIPRKPPKSMWGGEGEDSWEEEQKRGCCVYTSQGGSQKATELSRRVGGWGWSLQCIEGVEGCCLSAGGGSENQSSGHHLKTGLQGLRLWFLNSSGSFQDRVFPSFCLSKGYFSDSGPRPTLVTQLLQVSGCWLTSSFLKFGNLRLRDKN